MPGINIKENEPIDFAIRRLKRVLEKSGITKELKKREFYEPPSKIKKKNKSALKKKLSKKNVKNKFFNKLKTYSRDS